MSAPADLFDRVQPESRYNPELAVSDRYGVSSKRDPTLRRQRREARAEARADLRARYLAWREQWRKPDLRYGERCRKFIRHAVCGSHTFVRSTMIRHYVSCIITLQKFSECRH